MIEIIVIINDCEESGVEIKKFNSTSFRQLVEYSNLNSTQEFQILAYYAADLPKKHAGVGLARKIGMDEAVRRFKRVGNYNGIIVCLDADCAVSSNYIEEISKTFSKDPGLTGASIYYEHPLESKGIILYELFLRYYINAKRLAGHPWAYHPVGSSMVVKSLYYVMEGGMNRRKAGEDFYFLHKIIERGNFGEINTCVVYPSGRVSDRVPFGTGRSMMKYEINAHDLEQFYDFRIFIELRVLINSINSVWSVKDDDLKIKSVYNKLPDLVKDFVSYEEWQMQVNEAKINSNSKSTFDKRLFKWFDAFKVLKFVHYASENDFPRLYYKEMLKYLFQESEIEWKEDYRPKELLFEMRKNGQGWPAFR